MPISDLPNKIPEAQPTQNKNSTNYKFNQLSQEIREKIHDSPHTATVDPLMAQELRERETVDELKKRYAKWFIWILITQLFVMNAIFVITGVGLLDFSQWALNIYMSGTLAEVFGIVLVITKHLFPTRIEKK